MHAHAVAPQSRLRDKDLLAPERTLEFIEVGALLPREVKLARDGVRVGYSARVVKNIWKILSLSRSGLANDLFVVSCR